MNPSNTELGFNLLTIPVVVRVPLALSGRVQDWYSPVLSENSDAGAVQAKVQQTSAGFQIQVEGRGLRNSDDVTSALRALNHEILHAVMTRRPDLFFVHAAVVSISGQGLVLPGLSESGKSTLTLALLERGAQFLSDELLAFEPHSGLALPVPRAVKIRDICVSWFPARVHQFKGEGEGRLLPFEFLPSDVVSQPVPVRTIVAPKWSASARNQIEVQSRGSMLLTLTASALNFGAFRARSLDPLSRLVMESETGSLEWSDPHLAARQLFTAVTGSIDE